MSTEYKVGHKFWWVGSDNKRTQSEVTVTKVGRAWLTLSNGHRVDKTTLVADAGEFTSPGHCWESKSAFDGHASIAKAWSALQREVQLSLSVPKNVTLDDIKAAAAHLKLEIKP